MNSISKWLVMVIVLMMVFSFQAFGLGKGNGGKNRGNGGGSISTLTEAEKEGLLLMREEEKLARDVYSHLFALWGQPIFDNIAASEQRHMDAVLNLLNRYGLSDPAAGNAEGEFSDQHIQHLYESLTSAGDPSRVAALKVGATIEDLDIFDLEELLAETDNPNITRVYLNLVKGSRNHLRAFAGQLALLGESYVAQYLTQNEIDTIINSPRERGRIN